MMDIYLVRHGIAEDRRPGLSDFDRRLTDEGLRKMKAIGKGLKILGVKPDIILTSPLLRARETAEVIADTLGMREQVEQRPELACGCDLPLLARMLEAYAQMNAVMVVGHEPDFSTMIGDLIGTGEVEMKKGAVALVRVDGPVQKDGGKLVWLKPPKQLLSLVK